MTVLGIDPGVEPAVCAMRAGERPSIHLVTLVGEQPVHGGSFEEQLRQLILTEKPKRAVVEQVGPIAGQGLSSTARFMCSWGIIRGVLTGCGIPYVTVMPSVWKRRLLAGYDLGDEEKDPARRKVIQKESAIRYVRDNYPAVNLIRGRATTPDNNLAEAVCLAAWLVQHG